MRVLSILIPLLLVAPLAIADSHEPPNDGIQVAGLDTTDDRSDDLYLSICRLPNVPTGPGLLIVDCTASGLYEDTNKLPGLQIRAGVHDGAAYKADSMAQLLS